MNRSRTEDFGIVRFTHPRASTGRGHTGAITSPAFTATELTLSGGARMLGPGFVTAISASGQESPSDPTDRGTFSVAFKQSTTPVLPVPFAAPDRLRHTARVRVNRSLHAKGRA